MFHKFFQIFGDSNKRYLNKIQPLVDRINTLEPKFEIFSDIELKNKTEEFKKRLRGKETLNDLLPEAFALVREAAKRNLNQRHFDVQLIGGIVLHHGRIAEMKTGEGKTLTATLPLYLNALIGKGAHLVTVNDYLAKRDVVWMGQIYHAIGMSVGCIVHDNAYVYDTEYREKSQNYNSNFKTNQQDKERDLLGGFHVVEDFLRPCLRKEAYGADIVYGTNNEFGFDYLRDNLVYDLKEQIQRDFHFAIVDEVDSILIDEARTPLIISQPDYEASKLYKEFSRIVPRLKADIDYTVDEKMKTVVLTEQGIERIEKILGVENIYQEKGIKFLRNLEQALRAQAVNPATKLALFSRDRDYIVKNREVIIVDEFTGRLMPGRRWSGGLHQAIEAKEGVAVQPESKTLATITFQNLFRMYEKLAGMTGTAVTSAEEFEKVYHLFVTEVPTNKFIIRKNLPDRIYKTENGKFKAIIEEVKKRNKKGQPILIGTNSIDKNEYLAKLLDQEGIRVQVLNAKHHQKEGEIIAQTGKEGAVTVATNMAGRGVDIILGGNPPDFQEAKRVKENGGLHIIGVQRHEARRIDNQLSGRAGRQGDPGSSQFFVSLEDELLRLFGGDKIKNIMEILKIPEDQPIEASIISGVIERAQEKIEGLNFDLRKHVLEYDDVIAKHRNKIYFQRKEILKKNYSELKEFVLKTIEKEIKKIIETHFDNAGKIDHGVIFEEIKTIFPLNVDVFSKLKNLSEAQEVLNELNKIAQEFFEFKEKKDGQENIEKILRFVCLKTLDSFWMEHLDEMEHLKDAVQLQGYGGKDPLVEYKTEGHKIFQQLQSLIDFQIARTVFKMSIN
ncbi:preprotein translocase subunit SecA [bacterium (Candidatus Gribaldobacteria) CG_4_10_14_0_8_um_filter_33_9]|uniref:Protein translocase subunit SecA n=1 Tax=bacterium (Candidatus Gribaldobacteria) CG_4_10_14_0_8_um_filter_33_9 TaxID=2014266 RepID=A0A2M7RNU0_9BACT|nr:MAG: preprotein translocase subunit SecA [bacterium (Candidatus Gribaldobacteria) CG_4_10_14_0_8_um_filter_33_9]